MSYTKQRLRFAYMAMISILTKSLPFWVKVPAQLLVRETFFIQDRNAREFLELASGGLKQSGFRQAISIPKSVTSSKERMMMWLPGGR